MSWSFTASGPAPKAATDIKNQSNAFLGSRSDAEKVVVLSGVEAIARAVGQYADASVSISFYGHADQNGVSQYQLSITAAPTFQPGQEPGGTLKPGGTF